MKIATMVRGYIPAPRPSDMVYAPIDLAIDISKLMVERGHQVDYYGPLGSELPRKVGLRLKTENLRPLVRSQEDFKTLAQDTARMTHYVPTLWDQYQARSMFEQARKGKYDLLHFHHPEVAAPFAKLFPEVPVVYTLHDPVYDWYKEFLELYATPNQYYISISNNQRIPAPDLSYIDTVYNGIDTAQFEISEDEHDDYLLFAGRIVPEKGVKEAIQVAQETDSRLLIIGPVYHDQQGYFDQYVKPHLNEKILYLGFLERDDVVRYYQKAKALLAPIQWEEPFGLNMVEAMACGTPVIALRRGSVPEIIESGKTGFIVDSIAEMSEAVAKLDSISADDCRKHVEENFSLKNMVDGYEEAYRKVLEIAKVPKTRRAAALRRIRMAAKKSMLRARYRV